MKAAVLTAPGQIELADLPRPSCPAGGALIQVKACSVCTSDVKMSERGHRDLRYPRVLGHEVAGVVVECDTPGNGPEVGDRVQVTPGISCGECDACRRGADNRCERVGILGFTHDGGFAELMAVPAQTVRLGGLSRLPDGLPSEHAALAEPLACCINAQTRVHISERDRVLVVGAGPVGCLHAMLARARGVRHVLLAERSPARAQMAEKAEAGQILVGDDVAETIREATRAEGVDVIILACAATPIEPLVALLRPGGRMCMFAGLPHEQASLSLNANEIHYREICLVGAYGCTARQNRQAVQLIAEGAVDVSWLITKRVPLERLSDALAHVARRDGMRAAVTFA